MRKVVCTCLTRPAFDPRDCQLCSCYGEGFERIYMFVMPRKYLYKWTARFPNVIFLAVRTSKFV